MKRRAFLAAATLAALYGPTPAGAGQLEPVPDTGATPSLMLPDLGGRQHSLTDYRGRVVLINFWASWCPPCLAEMPSLERLHTAMSGRPFTILAVNSEETKSTVWKFTSLLKLDFTILLDEKGTASGDWQVEYFPTSFLLDREGTIRYVAYGPRQWDSRQLVEAIGALIEGGGGKTDGHQ
jgi:thiol-disulfide isomerase/thioredoxin